jgi:hypothetical protein
MPERRTITAVPASAIAQRILTAWARKDDVSLQHELREISRRRPSLSGGGGTVIEVERHELIRAIAIRMNGNRTSWSQEILETRSGVWLELLRQLSAVAPSGPAN